MKIWLITDTHLGHDAMVKYCGRPEDHSTRIIANLQKRVNAGDLLIHLGDICIGKDEIWHGVLMNALPGVKRVLLLGNHDRKSVAWYLAHGWDFVCERFDGKYFGKKVAFSHIPLDDDGSFEINVHGHFHNTLHRLLEGRFVVEGEKERNERDLRVLTKKHRLLAIENTNLSPVTLEKFIQ